MTSHSVGSCDNLLLIKHLGYLSVEACPKDIAPQKWAAVVIIPAAIVATRKLRETGTCLRAIALQRNHRVFFTISWFNIVAYIENLHKKGKKRWIKTNLGQDHHSLIIATASLPGLNAT